MLPFATEFPVRSANNRAEFVALVVSWLRGTNYSSVLDTRQVEDLEGETAYLKSRGGEELRLREFSPNGALEAIGFRHDFPDGQGRLWRTEAVLRRTSAASGQDIIRIRTQCIARQAGVRLETPRKPYFIKTILQDGWGVNDGGLSVSDQPHWLAHDEPALRIARAVTIGEAPRYLPIIYISATGVSTWLPSRRQIEILAFDLGGVAHVIVEPNRDFSFQLRDVTEGANAYDGTVAIAVPGRGIVRRFYLGWRLTDLDDLLKAVRGTALGIRSQMPAEGWDWTELQEQALRLQRERDRKRLSAKETEDLYNEEISNLKNRIEELEKQVAAQLPDREDEPNDGFFPTHFVKKVGPELCVGEFSDRLRLAVKTCVERADHVGLDKRSMAILNLIASSLPSSLALFELREDLKRATKDGGRVASQVKALLLRHGYQEKPGGKHVVLEPKNKFIGLGPIILPKTPSDNRGLTNLRKDIEKILGITKL